MEGMPQMTTKYKILWFVVDMHHRQRYFFICGCKRIVTLAGLKDRRRPLKEIRFSRQLHIPATRLLP
jgi:hypothetical protein